VAKTVPAKGKLENAFASIKNFCFLSGILYGEEFNEVSEAIQYILHVIKRSVYILQKNTSVNQQVLLFESKIIKL
jgi:hypothetical protein